ncbi:MAG: hypothetical protein RIS84_1876 [Pseudomonadota bacterium]|jgi:hypothetical protein
MQTFQLTSFVDAQGILRLQSQLPLTLANQDVEVLLVVQSQPKKTTHKRPIGLLKGQFAVPNSFFDNLSEEELEGFEGKA